METLRELDQQLFLLLNGFHTPVLDYFMMFISQTIAWIPLYAYLLYLIVREHKKESWIILICIAITIVLTDRITSGLMKPYFLRLRPSHEPALQHLVHLVKQRNGEFYKGGLYGFASSHAANTFGIATFFFLLLRPTHRWIGLLFAWAILVTYSRIYLGVHYPGDVLAGALVGAICAWIVFRLYRFYKYRSHHP
ncbi:phosphatase PAP2 family protein [Ohtaekwangia sp.]|uniref:phosphatase PAP2 family protein n=1 Tax=Ohtaekwangia sp. TaxID=2066019 RepID=UPI002FDD0ADD